MCVAFVGRNQLFLPNTDNFTQSGVSKYAGTPVSEPPVRGSPSCRPVRFELYSGKQLDASENIRIISYH